MENINSFSTGGAGTTFEHMIQALFSLQMLNGGFVPFGENLTINSIELQSQNFKTDDLVLHLSDNSKMLCQIKHQFFFQAADKIFNEVMEYAWHDFNSEKFRKNKDKIVIITGPLSAIDTSAIRLPLHEVKICVVYTEFEKHLTSKNKKKKFDVIRGSLNKAAGKEIDDDLWFSFLRHFYLLVSDLDIQNNINEVLAHSIIDQSKAEDYLDAVDIWARIVTQVSRYNSGAKHFNKNTFPSGLRDKFLNLKKTEEINKDFIVEDIVERETFEADFSQYERMFFSNTIKKAILLGNWSENVADKEVIENILDEDYSIWNSKLINIFQKTDNFLLNRNGYWKVENRKKFWDIYKTNILDSDIQKLLSIVNGNFLENEKISNELKSGILEALLFAISEENNDVYFTVNERKYESRDVIYHMLKDKDFIFKHYKFVTLIAQINPEAFLSYINELIQESGTIHELMKVSYVYDSVIKALEIISWNKENLFEASLILAKFANSLGEYSELNLAYKSLLNIYLPWLPQTYAGFDERKKFIDHLVSDSSDKNSDLCWNLLMKYIPNKMTTTMGTRKPFNYIEREKIKTREYFEQLRYFDMKIIALTKGNYERTLKLIEDLNLIHSLNQERVDENYVEQLLEVLSYFKKNTQKTTIIWEKLKIYSIFYEKYGNRQWKVLNEVYEKIKKKIDEISPENILQKNKYLFIRDEYKLYEGKNSFEEEQKKLFKKQKKAINSIYNKEGYDSILNFANIVEYSEVVGRIFFEIKKDLCEYELRKINNKNVKIRQFIQGYINKAFNTLGWKWVNNIDFSKWNDRAFAKFCDCLPFDQETWSFVDEKLKHNEELYWDIVNVFPPWVSVIQDYPIEKLLDHDRVVLALDLIDSSIHLKREDSYVSSNLIIRALKIRIKTVFKEKLSNWHYVEIINELQSREDVSQEGV